MQTTVSASALILLLAAVSVPFTLGEGAAEEESPALSEAEIALASRLTARETGLADYLRALGEHTVEIDREAGFGGRRLRLRIDEGRFDATVSVAAHRGHVAAVAIRVRAAGEPSDLASRLVAMSAGGLVESECEAHGAWAEPASGRDWWKERMEGLGVGPSVEPSELPRELRDAWATLVSPTEWYPVGTTYGDAGLTPDGCAAARVLVTEKVRRLLSSALRGANPEGRVEAALALLALERGGTELSEADRRAIEAIRSSDVRIELCRGCIVHVGVAAEAFRDDE